MLTGVEEHRGATQGGPDGDHGEVRSCGLGRSDGGVHVKRLVQAERALPAGGSVAAQVEHHDRREGSEQVGERVDPGRPGGVGEPVDQHERAGRRQARW